jgi:hypothetical protein
MCHNVKRPVLCALLLGFIACATAASEDSDTDGNAHNPDTAAVTYSTDDCPAVQFTAPAYERRNCELRDGIKIAMFSLTRDELIRLDNTFLRETPWEDPTRSYFLQPIFIALSDNIPKLLEISGFSKSENGMYKFSGSSLPPPEFHAMATARDAEFLTEKTLPIAQKIRDWLIGDKTYIYPGYGSADYIVDCTTAIKLPNPKQEGSALAFTHCIFDRYMYSGIPNEFIEKIRAINVLDNTVSMNTSPSFDCTKSTTEIERMICNNYKLIFLDILLSENYQKAIDKVPEKKALVIEQRAWLKSRNACKTDYCLVNLYIPQIYKLCRKYLKEC